MAKVLHHATGLEARFDAELAAEAAGWRGEWECQTELHPAAESDKAPARAERDEGED